MFQSVSRVLTHTARSTTRVLSTFASTSSRRIGRIFFSNRSSSSSEREEEEISSTVMGQTSDNRLGVAMGYDCVMDKENNNIHVDIASMQSRCCYCQSMPAEMAHYLLDCGHVYCYLCIPSSNSNSNSNSNSANTSNGDYLCYKCNISSGNIARVQILQ